MHLVVTLRLVPATVGNHVHRSASLWSWHTPIWPEGAAHTACALFVRLCSLSRGLLVGALRLVIRLLELSAIVGSYLYVGPATVWIRSGFRSSTL